MIDEAAFLVAALHIVFWLLAANAVSLTVLLVLFKDGE